MVIPNLRGWDNRVILIPQKWYNFAGSMDTNDLPLMAQTTYAELLDLSGALAFDIAFEEPGTFSAKTVKGSK